MLWRACDHWLTCELDPGNQRLPTPTPVLGMNGPPTIAIARDISRM